MHATQFHLLEIQNRQNQPNEIRVQAAGVWGSPVLDGGGGRQRDWALVPCMHVSVKMDPQDLCMALHVNFTS